MKKAERQSPSGFVFPLNKIRLQILGERLKKRRHFGIGKQFYEYLRI